jgi:Heparinase II/III-like protein/Heparinase II/III N-terminus
VIALAAVRPRPVYCVTEHEHRDRALAEAVAAGVFSHQGQTRELGLTPDWLGARLPADAEWRIEWVKFYYGLDLADAFRATGERRFLTAWERLVGSFVAQVPPEHDPSDVTARRVLNWLYAWQRLPEVAEPLAAALLDSIAAQAAHVRATLTPERNHRTLELYALLLTALALPSLDDGLLDFAVAELHANVLRDFRPDGVHREASTHYHMVALRSFAGARENCRRYGVALPAGFDERLSAACDFARACRRPDGTIPALSDSDTGDYGELLDLAARMLDRDDLRALPAGPASFPAGGYFFQRSGGRYLAFDCGPLGDGGHGHYDLLSVEAWDGPRPLVLDPGRFTYAEGEPNWRRWFRGTAAHNTVTVDGLDQTPYARGRSAEPAAEGRLLGRATARGLDVLAGEARSPRYDAVHVRRVALVDGTYWVIEDRLTAPTPHRYDLRFHLAPGDARVGAGGAVLGRDAALAVSGAQPALQDGWVSPRYGIRCAAPVVSAVAEGRDATFVTVLAARAPGRPAPLLMPGADGAVYFDLLAPDGALDRLAFGARAQARWTRRAADGTVLREVAVG